MKALEAIAFLLSRAVHRLGWQYGAGRWGSQVAHYTVRGWRRGQ
jgi:hypothetical protein